MTYAKPTIIRTATVAVLCLLACTIGIAGTALAVIVATCAYLPVRFIHHGKEGRKAAIFFHWADFVLGTAWLAGCAAALFYYLYCYIFLAPADKGGYRDGAPLLTVAAILITCMLLHGRDFMAKRWMERRLEVWQKGHSLTSTLARLLAAMGRRQVLRYRGRRLPNRIHPPASPPGEHRTALKYNKLTAARCKVCIFATLYCVFIAGLTIITHISK